MTTRRAASRQYSEVGRSYGTVRNGRLGIRILERFSDVKGADLPFDLHSAAVSTTSSAEGFSRMPTKIAILFEAGRSIRTFLGFTTQSSNLLLSAAQTKNHALVDTLDSARTFDL